MDLDADARLTLKEFTDGLTPSDPYSKCLKRIELNKTHKVQSSKANQFLVEEGCAGQKYDDVKIRALDRQVIKSKGH